MMRRGQVALYLLMTILVLAVVCFMNVDAFLAVRAKNRVQNAGDAATLAAARVQGETLNRIGRLNVDHILAAVANDAEKCRAIEREQRRLALLGPVEALRRANEAAKANGAKPRGDFAEILNEHIQTIRTVYSGGVNEDGEPYPEPWPGAWVEYASAIADAVSGGLACGPDNCEYYNAKGGHLLLNPNFYAAVAGRCWCWFHFNAEKALTDYGGWTSWGPLPSRKTNTEGNCELFSLHVQARTGSLEEVFSLEEIADLASRWGGNTVTVEELKNSEEIANPESVWFFFEPCAWSRWFDGLRLADEEDGDEFPLVGEVKAVYNVRGAASVCRCYWTIPTITGNDEAEITWSAAAKPFGKISDAVAGDQPVTAPQYRFFVLPVFEAVRLVPVDAVGGACLGTADLDWVNHVRKHLPKYLQSGPTCLPNCFYCNCLVDWEKSELHRVGTLWLKKNAGTCVRGSGSCGSHGGTSRGH